MTAVGDVPNVEWLASSGLLRDGLLVADERGEVAPGIVAAGDVAAVPTPLGVRRVPLWNSAIEQARVAAAHLVGADAEQVTAHPYFWTEQFGLSLKAVGHAPFAGEPVVVDGSVGGGRGCSCSGRTPVPPRAGPPSPSTTASRSPSCGSSAEATTRESRR